MSTAQSIIHDSRILSVTSGTALIIHDSLNTNIVLRNQLIEFGYDVVDVINPDAVISTLEKNNVDIIFITSFISGQCSDHIVSAIGKYHGDNYVPVVIICGRQDEDALLDCVFAGANDFLQTPFNATELKAKLQTVQQLADLKALYGRSVDEQIVGKKILSAILGTRSEVLDEIKVLSRSAAVFSGDLILIARQPNGNLNIMVSDFTGHGLSAAIGILPIADTFCVMTEKGFELDIILEQINNKLCALLPTGMFMATACVQLHSELEYARVWNAGMPDVFVLDSGDGLIKQRVASSCLPLGITKSHCDFVRPVTIEIAENDQIVLHTDGITEAINTSGDVFTEERLESVMQNSGDAMHAFNNAQQEFERFSGDSELADDVSLVCVPCVRSLFAEIDANEYKDEHVSHDYDGTWRWSMELSGASLLDVDPVSLLIAEYSKLTGQPVPVMDLQNIINELYENALEYGVFRTARKDLEKVYRCNKDSITNANLLDGSYVRLEMQRVLYKGRPAVLIKLEDSGDGFDHEALMQRDDKAQNNNDISLGYGLSQVRRLCDSVKFNETGNYVEVVIASQRQEGMH